MRVSLGLHIRPLVERWSKKILFTEIVYLSRSGALEPQPPALAQIEVWWPTTGSSVGGPQPFRAMLQGWSVWD